MIRTKIIVHKKKSKLKKVKKILKWDKIIILMKYKNQLIYWLYDRKSDSIIISNSVDFNEDLLTNENIKNNEIINQNSISEIKLFIKFFNKKNQKNL